MTEKQLISYISKVYNAGLTASKFKSNEFLCKSIRKNIETINTKFVEDYDLNSKFEILKLKELFDVSANIGSLYNKSYTTIKKRNKLNKYELCSIVYNYYNNFKLYKDISNETIEKYFRQEAAVKFGAISFNYRELIDLKDFYSKVNNDILIDLQYKFIINLVSSIYDDFKNYLINLNTNPNIKFKNITFSKLSDYGGVLNVNNDVYSYQPFILIDCANIVNMVSGDERGIDFKTFKQAIGVNEYHHYNKLYDVLDDSYIPTYRSVLYFPFLNKFMYNEKDIKLIDIDTDILPKSDNFDYRNIFSNGYMPENIFIGNLFNNLLVEITTDDDFTFNIVFNKNGEASKVAKNLYGIPSISDFLTTNRYALVSNEVKEIEDNTFNELTNVITKSFSSDFRIICEKYEKEIDDTINIPGYLDSSLYTKYIPFIKISDIAQLSKSYILFNFNYWKSAILSRLSAIKNGKFKDLNGIFNSFSIKILYGVIKVNQDTNFDTIRSAFITDILMHKLPKCDIKNNNNVKQILEDYADLVVSKEFVCENFYIDNKGDITSNISLDNNISSNAYVYYYNQFNDLPSIKNRLDIHDMISLCVINGDKYKSMLNDSSIYNTEVNGDNFKEFMTYFFYKNIYTKLNDIIRRFNYDMNLLEDPYHYPNLSEIKSIYKRHTQVPITIKSNILENMLNPKVIGFNSNKISNIITEIAFLDSSNKFNIVDKPVINYTL